MDRQRSRMCSQCYEEPRQRGKDLCRGCDSFNQMKDSARKDQFNYEAAQADLLFAPASFDVDQADDGRDVVASL